MKGLVILSIILSLLSCQSSEAQQSKIAIEKIEEMFASLRADGTYILVELSKYPESL
ncbi:hypothetical protein SAMN05660841_00028 [Sphingobacterium nematocida]|uniref:Uncharacterized protein n=1 Tax=Sphingobacterium nematocida TaxID=1513896 RepID=A0A1T5ANH7_9SPHI|nr:hypothetical protein [Sphingobacterium nematocida]SKB36367.1 hypothetical protein SAMN05660841_00028 [Sphingobacterium nematocida]